MATRCTTIEQFVATFHRFCGDDQTFFVATMTSRPVGLETAFSIQLADKQPVLRGMCVVLDAWPTPENRYKRPGIRLGIKRLTADSEPVFERLRAAARAPVALAEATPAPGAPPGPPSQELAVVATGELPALEPVATAPAPVAKPAPRRAVTPPPLPPLVTPRAGLPSVRTAPVPEIKPPPLPPIAIKPVIAVPPIEAVPPAPIEVTRFQVALHVDTIPPPIGDLEFKAAPLLARPRVEPRIVSDAPPDEPIDPGAPAVIVDRPSELAPTVAAPRAAEQRTPGSDLVLPANPLHDLTDESLEGFVDCTLYEETGNFFHPGLDPAFSDERADPPAAPLSTRSVPAMPFDEAPELAVRTVGDTESLRVAPPAVAPPAVVEALPVVAPLPVVEPLRVVAPPDDAAEPSSASAPPAFSPQATGAFSPHTSVYAVADVPRAMSTIDMAPPLHTGPYPAMDPGFYQRYAPPAPPPRWHRPLIIGGTAVAAIVVAFLLARLARGPDAAAPPPITSHSTARPAPAAAPPPPAPVAPRPAVAPDEEADASGPAVVGHGPCRFTVATTPAGSQVRLDDQAIGPSPLTIDTTCDRHRIDVSHARYQAVSRTVALSADKPTALDISLPRPTHAVVVTSTPSGAELSIDGHRAGTTPTIIQMMGFSTVNLTFSKPGYQTVTKKVYSKTADDHVAVKLTR